MTNPVATSDRPGMQRGTGEDGAHRVVLIVTGAVAAALMPAWVLDLRHRRGWDIRCVLTRAAGMFTTKQALAAMSGNPAYDDGDWSCAVPSVLHKDLAEWANLVVVAPATLNFLSAIETLRAQTLAETVVAYTGAPTLLLPSVSGPVVRKPIYRSLLRGLSENGLEIVEASGPPVSIHDVQTEEGGMPSLQDLDDAITRRQTVHWMPSAP